jgi:antitoxin HicB
MTKRDMLRQRIQQNPANTTFRNAMTSKSLERFLKLPYTIELTPDVEGYWFTQIPRLPGCMTQAPSRSDALNAIDEAKTLWLETALAEGIPIPEPVGAEIR